ncbi:MAG: hypothetical protein KDH15_11530 [Rhodocyclaceae bacterium]|nr:hypothetical protein [Rhodocyclaceae bacterium]
MLPGYEGVRETVATAIAAAGLEMLRMEALLEDWEWLDWLDDAVRHCDLVLADPSRHNAFVMYELAVARPHARPTLVILDRDDTQLSGSLDGTPFRLYANDALEAFSARLYRDLLQLAAAAGPTGEPADPGRYHASAIRLLAEFRNDTGLPVEAVDRVAFGARLGHAMQHGTFVDSLAPTPLGAAGLLAALIGSSRMVEAMAAIRDWTDRRGQTRNRHDG